MTNIDSVGSKGFHAPFLQGGEYAIDAQISHRLLAEALSRGGEYADLYFEFHGSSDYVLEEGAIKEVGRGIGVGLGVRVIKGDATGYAYTEDLSMERMLHAARTAGQIAQGQKTVDPVAIVPRGAPAFYPVKIPSILTPPLQKLEFLRAADAAGRAYDSRITKMEASLVESLKEVLVICSDGAWTVDRQPMIRFGVRAIAEVAGKRQAGSSGGGGRFGLEYFDKPGCSPAEHGREAARIAIAMLDAQEAPAGEMEVVLAPGDSGILLHEAVGHGLEADFNRKKTSNYTDQIGKQVASTLCTVVDDGTVDYSRGSINIDDEGFLGSRNLLIEKGILVGYMHDRLSAKHYGIKPTGNGRRQSFRHMPLPRMTNTSLLAGEHGAEEILRSVKKGVFARRFSGGQVNISNGDFVFSLTESYLIEDGKITAPLKGVNLIGNGPEVLRNVTMLGTDFASSDGMWTCGKDGQSVPVGVGTPTVKIANITVGGTKTA